MTKGVLFKKDVYVRCDVEMTGEQLLKLFLKDPNMNSYTKPMALNYAAGSVFGAAAGLLITLPLIDELRDSSDPNWTLAYIGAGCLAASIPFKIAFKKKARKAIAYYNSGYKEAPGVSMKLGINNNGLGLVMNF
ncbi:hypothetical protein [Mangrovibacterium lignilyticum]|uniref:hypothetical protein n=1 Tax=Mangrovibacterium lignilyticum TaxID=2668052 RepID=UPI0013D6F204|nr:hypothetical protein [Mangrovibacterium lignilyticum]